MPKPARNSIAFLLEDSAAEFGTMLALHQKIESKRLEEGKAKGKVSRGKALSQKVRSANPKRFSTHRKEFTFLVVPAQKGSS
jgi:hypothetical protein